MNAQQTNKTTHRVASNGSTTAQSNSSDLRPLMPFDLQLQVLPAHYVGTDLEHMWALLRKIEASETKSEFETQKDFEARLSKALEEPITATFKRTDLFAVVLPIEAAQYDAEKQELPLFIPYSVSSYSNHGATLWKWKDHYTRRPGYVGSNAFGATTDVSIATSTDYNLIASLPSWLDRVSYSEFDKASYHSEDLRQLLLKLNPQDAQRLKPILKALVIGTLASPASDENVRHDGATLSSPIDFTDTSRNVHMNITQFWVFDDSTGEVLKRYAGVPTITQELR